MAPSERIITSDHISEMEKLVRVQFATSLPGAKPLCLVGTQDQQGLQNLAPFSSITHLGSNPLLLGMVTRPDTVERHTLSNILATNHWTLNHVPRSHIQAAHQCSARYPKDQSEFSVNGFTPQIIRDLSAPSVAESHLSIGLQLAEIVDINSNGTKLIVGEVQWVKIEETLLQENGAIDITPSVASTALDTYFTLKPLAKLPYAKVK